MTDESNPSHQQPPIDQPPQTETAIIRWPEFTVPPTWVFDPTKPVASFENLFVLWMLAVMYNGSITRIGAPKAADSPEAVADYLDAEPLTINELLEEIALACNASGIKIASRIVKAAINKIIRRKQKERKKALYGRLTKPMAEDARKEVQKLFDQAAEVFDMPAYLASACLSHWIWQVKRKMLGHNPDHHMMLIIYSSIQGTGKTTFTSKLVDVLEEFASADVLLSDFADGRSADIYRFAVLRFEDMGQAAAASVPTIKSLITSTSINRRPQRTSNTITLRQAATLIGTANRPIHELIDDDTGHRRFVMMPFKNGNVANGGDEKIWKIINELDFEQLWRAVDAFAPSPIEPFLKDLHDYQISYRPLPKVHKWVRELDLMSEEVRRITVRGGVRAAGLRDLYVAQTGDTISTNKFADEMLICTKDSQMPFSGRQHKEIGSLYILRPEFDRCSENSPRISPMPQGPAEPTSSDEGAAASEIAAFATEAPPLADASDQPFAPTELADAPASSEGEAD